MGLGTMGPARSLVGRERVFAHEAQRPRRGSPDSFVPKASPDLSIPLAVKRAFPNLGLDALNQDRIAVPALRCLPAWNIDPLEGEISVEN